MKIKHLIPIILNTKNNNLPAKIYKGLQSIQQAAKEKGAVVSKECAQSLKAVFISGKIVRRTLVRSTGSNQLIPAYITKTKNGPVTSLVMKDAAGNQKLGTALLMKTDEASFSGEAIQDYILNSFEIVWIKSVNSSRDKGHFKGIGTELIKECVRESFKKGFKGRLYLDALHPQKPPTPFYYKCGFRFSNREQNKLMEEYIAGKTKLGILPDSISQGFMYLPDENIPKVLEL